MYEAWEEEAIKNRAAKFSLDYPDIGKIGNTYMQGVFHPGIDKVTLSDMMFEALIQATFRYTDSHRENKEVVWYCIHNTSEDGKIFGADLLPTLFNFHRRMQQLGAVRVTLNQYKGEQE